MSEIILRVRNRHSDALVAIGETLGANGIKGARVEPKHRDIGVSDDFVHVHIDDDTDTVLFKLGVPLDVVSAEEMAASIAEQKSESTARWAAWQKSNPFARMSVFEDRDPWKRNGR